MLLDAEKEELSIAATQALSVDYISKPPLKIGESVSGRAVKEKKPIMVMDVTKDKTYRYPEIAKREGIASMLSVPMLVGHRAIGVINSYTQQPHRFHEEEVKILQAVANQAAVAIENTRLREENLSVKQALEQRKVVERAKYLLMERDRLTEEKAYRILQKMSRDHRKSMGEVASALLLASSLSNKER
jgi:GAF domain-containing protein